MAVAVSAVAGCGGATGSDRESDPGGWTAPNADLRNTRQVSGPIDSRSVGRLRVAWTVPLTAGYATTPVIVDGVAYTQDLQSNVYAIDVHDGRRLWTTSYEETDTGPNGVNVADGRVYGATPGTAFALDPSTGRELWRTTLARHPGDAIDMAPGHHDGTVYVSTAVAGIGAVGTLWALDAATGREKWHWAQVPEDLWGRPDVNSGGGLWHPPAFDEHGDLYVSVANPLPFPGVEEAPWGSSRPGPNRWTNSIVKLDAATGRIVWARQVLPHDLYDWDLECPVILETVRGRLTALVAGKMGFAYAFDATTGELLWKTSVGVHNGHDDDNLLAMRGDAAKLRVPAKVLPGDWGGVETQMASDGRTLYVPVNNLYSIYRAQAFPEQQDTMEGTGEMVALDVATGRIKWDRRLPHSPYGAASISDDLVFTTTYEGMVWALNTRTGAVAWRSRLPAGTIAPVAIAGDTIIAAGSVPLNARQRPQIVAYRLGAR